METGVTLEKNLGFNPLSCAIIFRVHATIRMFQRDINQEDVFHILNSGIIIEVYADDFPFPSVLINGETVLGKPLHAVVGYDASTQRIFIITVYDPDSQKWANSYSIRKHL